MKIIIDIPEDTYRRYKLLDDNRITDRPIHYIAHGKPLQKGHGRLIDVNTLEDTIYRLNVKENAQITRHEYKIIDNVIFEMPTIIEADKESEDKE